MKKVIRRAQDILVEKHMSGNKNPILQLNGRSYVTYNKMWDYIDLYTKLLLKELAEELTKKAG